MIAPVVNVRMAIEIDFPLSWHHVQVSSWTSRLTAEDARRRG